MTKHPELLLNSVQCLQLTPLGQLVISTFKYAREKDQSFYFPYYCQEKLKVLLTTLLEWEEEFRACIDGMLT